MRVIALGADHARFRLKEDIKSWLRERGFLGGRHTRRVETLTAIGAGTDAPTR